MRRRDPVAFDRAILAARATASLAVRPDVQVDQYVLVDQGLALNVITPAEAEALLSMYDEIGHLLDAAESDPPEPARAQGGERDLRG
jgi:hydrogenase maturation factor